MEGLARLAAAHGVATRYEPAPGQPVPVPVDTVIAVLAALGVDASTPRAVHSALRDADAAAGRLVPPTVAWRQGQPAPSWWEALPEGTALRVHTEDGRTLDRTRGARTGEDWSQETAAEKQAPGAAPAPRPGPGAHALRATAPDGRTADATLVVSPARLAGRPPRPGRPGSGAQGRTFGLLVQLYSLLSSRSWGMGDLVDLADLASWAGHTLGAGFLQLNPLHAAVPGAAGEPTDPSPYRPGTRRFPDPVHVRVEDIPEYAYLDPAARQRVAGLLARAATLRTAVLEKGAPIDRDATWALKREALEIVRGVPLSPGRRAAYNAFLAGQGQALEDHATWCALAELYGPDWRRWPAGLRDPRSVATRRARADHLERIDFHSWLTWLADSQLARAQRVAEAAGMPVGLVHDLALGVHPHGSDSWTHQDLLAAGVSTGAPPDAFNAGGQDWGLPPWRPDRLAATGYAPYRDLLSGLLRHAGGLRVDHVMGQFRLWWIPEGARPAEGTYVSYDAEAMLGALALEAHRAGAVVVGEDLGTVGPGVREDLADRGIHGTSVLWFERDYDRAGRPPLEPEQWRPSCLATVTTHDLPPTAARLDGEYTRLLERLGLPAGGRQERAENEEWLRVFARLGLLRPGAGEEERIAAAYRFLAATPARMIGIWLPDAVGDRRPQNLPGTWQEYPNWRLPLAGPGGRPVTLEELASSERAAALARAVREELHRRAAGGTP